MVSNADLVIAMVMVVGCTALAVALTANDTGLLVAFGVLALVIYSGATVIYYRMIERSLPGSSPWMEPVSNRLRTNVINGSVLLLLGALGSITALLLYAFEWHLVLTLATVAVMLLATAVGKRLQSVFGPGTLLSYGLCYLAAFCVILFTANFI